MADGDLHTLRSRADALAADLSTLRTLRSKRSSDGSIRVTQDITSTQPADLLYNEKLTGSNAHTATVVRSDGNAKHLMDAATNSETKQRSSAPLLPEGSSSATTRTQVLPDSSVMDLSRLRSQHSDNDVRLAKALGEIAALKSAVATHEHVLSATQDQLQQRDAAYSALLSQYRILETESSRLKTTVVECQTDREGLRAALARQQQTHMQTQQMLTERLSTLQHNVNSLEKDVEQKKSALAEASAALSGAKARIQSLEERLDGSRQDTQQHTAMIESQQARVDELNARLNSLKESHAAQTQKASDLKQRCSDLETELRDVKQRNSEQQEEIKLLRAQLASARSTAAKLTAAAKSEVTAATNKPDKTPSRSLSHSSASARVRKGQWDAEYSSSSAAVGVRRVQWDADSLADESAHTNTNKQTAALEELQDLRKRYDAVVDELASAKETIAMLRRSLVPDGVFGGVSESMWPPSPSIASASTHNQGVPPHEVEALIRKATAALQHELASAKTLAEQLQRSVSTKESQWADNLHKANTRLAEATRKNEELAAALQIARAGANAANAEAQAHVTSTVAHLNNAKQQLEAKHSEVQVLKAAQAQLMEAQTQNKRKISALSQELQQLQAIVVTCESDIECLLKALMSAKDALSAKGVMLGGSLLQAVRDVAKRATARKLTPRATTPRRKTIPTTPTTAKVPGNLETAFADAVTGDDSSNFAFTTSTDAHTAGLEVSILPTSPVTTNTNSNTNTQSKRNVHWQDDSNEALVLQQSTRSSTTPTQQQGGLRASPSPIRDSYNRTTTIILSAAGNSTYESKSTNNNINNSNAESMHHARHTTAAEAATGGDTLPVKKDTSNSNVNDAAASTTSKQSAVVYMPRNPRNGRIQVEAHDKQAKDAAGTNAAVSSSSVDPTSNRGIPVSKMLAHLAFGVPLEENAENSLSSTNNNNSNHHHPAAAKAADATTSHRSTATTASTTTTSATNATATTAGMDIMRISQSSQLQSGKHQPQRQHTQHQPHQLHNSHQRTILQDVLSAKPVYVNVSPAKERPAASHYSGTNAAYNHTSRSMHNSSFAADTSRLSLSELAAMEEAKVHTQTLLGDTAFAARLRKSQADSMLLSGVGSTTLGLDVSAASARSYGPAVAAADADPLPFGPGSASLRRSIHRAATR